MSIKYAILGLLSWKPSTGYELKKVFEESSTMYWSGNNNQIYKALVQLLDEGLVTNEVQHNEGSPSKKIYTITTEGLDELREWVLSNPEAPEFKKTFLIQLAWAGQLNNAELNGLLSRYENEVKMQLLLQQEKERRGIDSPGRNRREEFIWSKISENLISSYKNELDWVQGVRKELFEKEIIEERSKMSYKVIENGTKKYVEFISSADKLASEQDALDLVALCGENDTNLLMLHGSALSEDFFRLKTGIAGGMLQKFINYYVKTAVIIPESISNKGRFREMALEANKGNQFRIFENREAAESWLIS
jgi:DNA-binding PadR family transcriptional regulator